MQQSHYSSYRPVNQLWCDQICSASLLMMDNKCNSNLKLILQFSVDLAWGHIAYVYETLAEQETVNTYGPSVFQL